MSILDAAEDWCKRGELFRLTPQTGRLQRTMYVSRSLQAFLTSSAVNQDRLGILRRDLDRFVAGGLLSVAEISQRARTAYFAQLTPKHDEVWEIRLRKPPPSVRIFGRFAAYDVFIAFFFEDRKLLDAKGSRAWRDAIVRCKTEWQKLFPAYQPHQGVNADEYLSNFFYI
jgi:hypothetical protein